MGVCVEVWRLGRTTYLEALALQRDVHARRKAGHCVDTLLLTEHAPVLTLGRGADERFLRVPRATLAQQGIALIRTERGGDVTYHGPGQLVAYPILDLRDHGRDLHLFVRRLEETALEFLRTFGLEGRRLPGTPGIWMQHDKIASVGVFVSRWTSMHGIAINIAPALEHFDLIHPCGLVGQRMTSIAAICATSPSMEEAFERYATAFAQVFGVELVMAPGSSEPIASSVRHHSAS